MVELAKKVGSLALAVGALALVLVNAALNHGCAGSQAAANAQAGPVPDDLSPPNPDAGPERAQPATPGDDDCVPSYMPATKAPVYLPDKCRPGRQSTQPAGKSAVSPSNAPQQAR